MTTVSSKFLLFTTMPILLFAISGCADNRLAELEVEPGNKVATFQVIDGM